MPVNETAEQAYERGVSDGKVASRVDSHDRRLGEAEALLAAVIETNRLLGLTVQAIDDRAESDRKQAVALALALKEADTERQRTGESKWTPWGRFLYIGFGVAAVIYGYLSSR